ncbi:uncharacterized protein LOC119267603 isoform X1 [Triticum dicoccoides]|uniref:uncharacterized protein LOC119267603 isoform X1 n=1 Tax=Triticum dicoccoides TaxID=85692 RepID=UPI001890AB0E|nr:uncharacterized protein LOC119267603 isoform X1 [Triticum dicoccoides]
MRSVVTLSFLSSAPHLPSEVTWRRRSTPVSVARGRRSPVDGGAVPASLRPVRLLCAPCAGAARAAPALHLSGKCACCAPSENRCCARYAGVLAAWPCLLRVLHGPYVLIRDFSIDFLSNMLIFFCCFFLCCSSSGQRRQGSQGLLHLPIVDFSPKSEDCIGAIDGTHVRASVTPDMEPAFRGRKKHTTQNVMAAVDFDLRFTYVLAGWEGTAHDATVLRDALIRENGLRVPQGKNFLVDAGYGVKPGFLPPFRGVRYHLNEWGNSPVQNDKELFNLRHSSLRTTVERAFGSLKRRFKILDDATPFFLYPTQVDIVVACCIIQNWVLNDGIDEYIIPEDEWVPNITHASTSAGQAEEHAYMVNFRQGLADQMWEDRQNYMHHQNM